VSGDWPDEDEGPHAISTPTACAVDAAHKVLAYLSADEGKDYVTEARKGRALESLVILGRWLDEPRRVTSGCQPGDEGPRGEDGARNPNGDPQMDNDKRPAVKKAAAIRNVTRTVYDCLLADEWPTDAGVKDFGLESTEHYGALQYELRSGSVSLQQLDQVLGNGPAITALIRKGNPYGGVTFRTMWDDIAVDITSWPELGELRDQLGRVCATPAVLKLVPSGEIIAGLKRHAAAESSDVEAYTSSTGEEFCIYTQGPTTVVSVLGEF
jgi:hypothetical protein